MPQLTVKTADRIEQLGRYLEQKRGDEVMRDIETFARRRPWMLAGVGMLAGMAAARFMKASSEERHGDYRRLSPVVERDAGADLARYRIVRTGRTPERPVRRREVGGDGEAGRNAERLA